jgi:hypothetical protein
LNEDADLLVCLRGCHSVNKLSNLNRSPLQRQRQIRNLTI